MSAAVKKTLQSGEWSEKKDPKSGKTYYVNKVTKQTTWDLEKELAKAPSSAASGKKGGPRTVADVLALGEWTEKKDAKSGKTYYFHKATKKTTWDLAKELGLEAGVASSPTAASTDGGDGGHGGGSIAEQIRAIVASGEWSEKKDAKTGKTYYVNKTTKKTTWDLVKQLGLKEPTAAAGSAAAKKPKRNYDAGQAIKSGEWRETADYQGEKYFVNTVTGETTAELKLFLEIQQAIDEGEFAGGAEEAAQPDPISTAGQASGEDAINDWVSIMLHAPGHPAAAERVVQPYLDETTVHARVTANSALASQIKDQQEIAALRARNTELEAALEAHQKEVHQLQCAVFYGMGSAAHGYAPPGLDPLHANSVTEPNSLTTRVHELERLVRSLQGHNRGLQAQLEASRRNAHHVATACTECAERDPWRRLMTVAAAEQRRPL